jgi:hypothetical protein
MLIFSIALLASALYWANAAGEAPKQAHRK